MFKEMKAYAHLKPGQDGTKRLVEEYGDRLLLLKFFKCFRLLILK